MENSPNNNENNSYQNNTNMNLNSFISNQNTVSTNNTNQAGTVNENRVEKMIVIIIFIAICIAGGYLFYLKNIIIITNKVNLNKNKISHYSVGIKGTEINTSLDLAGIFVHDHDLFNSYYSLENNTKAIIHNNKIYFSYSPAYCSDYSEDLNNLYLKSYLPISKTNLCDKYDKKHNKSYDDLLYRNFMYANLDGTKIKEVNRFESQNSIIFNYADDNYLFYSVLVDDSVHKLDLSNNKSSIFYSYDKKLLSVANYPLSNKANIVTISQKKLDNKNFTLDYYDYKSLKKRKSIAFQDIVNILRLDKYDSTSLYTISNSFGKDYVNIYKNNSIIYTLNGINRIDEIFATKNYIYIFYRDQNQKLLVKKIDKDTYEEKEFKGSLDIGGFLDYISTGSDGNAYLLVDDSVYSFSETDDKFSEVIKEDAVLSRGMVGDYLYVYIPGFDLIVYNTKTKKRIELKKVEYYYFDNDKLYVVHQNENDIRLIYYKI